MGKSLAAHGSVQFLTRLVPALTLFIAIIFSISRISLPLLGDTMPPYMLAVVFVWAIYRPDWLPVWGVFVAGLVFDALAGLPLGLTAVLLVAVYWPITMQRQIFLREPFPFLWLSFAVVLVVVEMLRWLLVSLLTLDVAGFGLVLANIGLGCGIFPVIGWMLIRCNHVLTGAELAGQS